MNDNDPTILDVMPTRPDAHGQAALLLVESLIHGLCEQSILSTSEAVAIAERAVDVQLVTAQAGDDVEAPAWHAQILLISIAASFSIDDHHQPSPLLS